MKVVGVGERVQEQLLYDHTSGNLVIISRCIVPPQLHALNMNSTHLI